MSRGPLRTVLDRPAGIGGTLRIILGGKMGTRHRDRRIGADMPIARAQPQRVFGAVDGFFEGTINGESVREPGMSQREVWIEVQCAAEGALRLGLAAASNKHHTVCQMS